MQSEVHMKKKLLFMLTVACVACLSAVLLTACSSSSGSDDQGQASSEDNSADISTLIVGFDNSYPPYGFMDENNQPTGFDLDLATEVANRNGWDVQLEPIDWDAKDALLNQDTINCIWNGFTMEGREDDYTFSEPYMLNEQVVVVRADSGITSLDDLAGKIVVTQVDSAALDVLQGDKADLAATFGELQTLPDYNNAFMQLESGMVDAVACDLSIAQYQMSANPDTYTQLDEPLSSEHYAVGFKKGNDALAQKVSDTLRDMYNDGTVEQLINKYADYGMSIDNWVLK